MLAELLEGIEAYTPPQRIPVSEAASQYLMIVQPGGYTGTWSATETPYMVEPMNLLASRRHEAVCFVGPARSGKTLGLLDAWIAYIVTCDPGDMLVLQMTQDKAREYSKTRIDRAIRHSPKLSELKSSRGHDDNTHDKLFKHGMWLKIGWPSATQLSSSDYRYVALTDYDRMPDDVDGEGSPFRLALKRTTTFLSRGMCMVESSPGREIIDPNWRPATPHEAPPVSGGILQIYNSGDRRQRYWQCPHCSEWFRIAPGLELFASLPPMEDLMAVVRTADLSKLAAEHAYIYCPHCGGRIGPELKARLSASGVWLKDGQRIRPDGTIEGEGMSSSIASFWLSGVEAAYQSWNNLILRYLQGLREYAASGAEESLRATVNTDQAMPYMPAMLRESGRTGALEDLAEDFPRYVVPPEARFLTAAVDVQGGQMSRFVVQVVAHGIAHEQWLIDRYEITLSPTREGSEEDGRARIDPAQYPEDWQALNQILESTYRTHEECEELRVYAMIVDSGGEEGVTENAYQWWRSLPTNMRSRAILYKGNASRNAPMVKLTKVGWVKRRGKKTSAGGDVPLLLCNPDLLKDAVYNGITRTAAGPGKIHLPQWVSAAFWDELRAEVRGPGGKWQQVRKRNEALDLFAMTRALTSHLGVARIKWDSPPHWARPLDVNSQRVTREERRDIQRQQQQQPIRFAKKRPKYLI